MHSTHFKSIGLTEVERVSLKQIATQKLRTAIMQGELKPGQRLTEPDLCQKLGVAQATIREALIELEHMGFVQRAKPRKTYVTKLTHDEIDQLYEVRIALELLAIDILCSQPMPSLTNSASCLRLMLESASTGDINSFKNHDLEFHRGLWAATGNGVLADALERIVVKLFAFALVTIQNCDYTSEPMTALAEKHGNILACIRARDVRQARETLIGSMDRTWITVSTR